MWCRQRRRPQLLSGNALPRHHAWLPSSVARSPPRAVVMCSCRGLEMLTRASACASGLVGHLHMSECTRTRGPNWSRYKYSCGCSLAGMVSSPPTCSWCMGCLQRQVASQCAGDGTSVRHTCHMLPMDPILPSGSPPHMGSVRCKARRRKASSLRAWRCSRPSCSPGTCAPASLGQSSTSRCNLTKETRCPEHTESRVCIQQALDPLVCPGCTGPPLSTRPHSTCHSLRLPF